MRRFFESSGVFAALLSVYLLLWKRIAWNDEVQKKQVLHYLNRSSLIHFDVAASQSLPYSSVGAEQNRSINRQRFLCHRYFPAKGGKVDLLRHSLFSLSTFLFDTCDTLARDTSNGWKWLKRQGSLAPFVCQVLTQHKFKMRYIKLTL